MAIGEKTVSDFPKIMRLNNCAQLVSHRKLAQRKAMCGLAIAVVVKDRESILTCEPKKAKM